MAKVRPQNQKAVSEYFKRVFGMKPEDFKEETRSRAPARLERLTALYETGAGNELAGVRGTWWAAFNAVTQYVDHEIPTAVRGSEGMDDADKALATRSKRFEASQSGSGAEFKDEAFSLALEAVA